VNCSLYGGWRLGKRKPGVIADGEGLVEAVGESIEVGGVGLCGGVGVGAGESDGALVVYLSDKAFRVGELKLVRVAVAMSEKVAAMCCARALGTVLVLAAKKDLEAKRRADRCFIALSPSLATSVAEAFMFFMLLDPGRSRLLAHRWGRFSEGSPGGEWKG